MKVLLTGGNKGIGKAILNDLVKENYEIILVGRHIGKKEYAKDICFLECDLSNIKDVTRLCEIISNEKINILINNAGCGKPIDFEKLTIEQINYELNLNFISHVLLMQAVLPYMKQSSFGRIINISSISGKQGTPYLETYSAAKAALNSVTQSLAKNLLEKGITINAICPGGVKTDMSCEGRENISKLMNLEGRTYEKSMIDNIGIGRLISPEEISKIVMFLIDKNISYISGQCFNICGALELR